MIFLRFPNEQTYLDKGPPYTDEGGNVTTPDLDVIGLIYEGGEYDEEGNMITPPTPNKPHRVFSGY